MTSVVAHHRIQELRLEQTQFESQLDLLILLVGETREVLHGAISIVDRMTYIGLAGYQFLKLIKHSKEAVSNLATIGKSSEIAEDAASKVRDLRKVGQAARRAGYKPDDIPERMAKFRMRRAREWKKLGVARKDLRKDFKEVLGDKGPDAAGKLMGKPESRSARGLTILGTHEDAMISQQGLVQDYWYRLKQQLDNTVRTLDRAYDEPTTENIWAAFSLVFDWAGFVTDPEMYMELLQEDAQRRLGELTSWLARLEAKLQNMKRARARVVDAEVDALR